jgi:MoaA/NifB/PqqE/SkfB family radical SAM enzyme
LPRPLPLFERLQIESQALCNRDCWFCPRTHDRSGAYLDGHGRPVSGELSTERILTLLDEAAGLGFLGPVGFFSYSEPLMDKRHLLLARAAAHRGMRPQLHTNGDALRKRPDLIEEVRESYRDITIGLYDYDSDEELESARAFWRAALPDADVAFSYIGDARRAHSVGTPRALTPRDRRYAFPDLVYSNAPCHRPLLRMIIRYDGEMCLCCEDLRADFTLGNVHHSTLEELWYSDRHVAIIGQLVEGRRKAFALCSVCPMSPTGPPSGGTRIRMNRRTWPASDSAIPS